ncbi:MAG: FAD-binding protein [Lachnospiraceae bacterium]|nr:FAD-binding protein [Lachnospiraceae bacterium]
MAKDYEMENERGLSRRDFLKGTATGAVGVAAVGLLGAGTTFTSMAEETVAEPQTEIERTEQGISGSYEISEIIETDAVVVGCGAAGIQAALTLQAGGVNTYLLEKGLSCGVSNGSQAGGPALAETRVQEAEDATVSVQTLYECEYGFSNGTVNGALLKKCIEQGERVVSNFMDNGVNMGLRRDAYGMGFRARHNFANDEGTQVSGTDRFQPLIDKFEEDGGVFETLREGIALVKTGDTVTGIIVQNLEDNTYIQYNAKAVLVATGGYAGNDTRLREHFGDMEIYPLCNTLSDGKGYDMVIAAGGIADRNWALCCNEFGGVNTKIEGASGSGMAFANAAEKFAIYGGLLVNRMGERFMNEQYMSDRPLALGGEMVLREGKFYAVIDEATYETSRDEGIFAYYGSPEDWYVGATGLEGVVLDALDDDMETAISEGWAVKGTLAECAEFFGMTGLEEAVEAYNELCEAGVDEQFYKDSYLLKALEGDTFYVMEYIPSIWCTFGGVKTDAYCRALTKAQEPIPGLYVAGVDNGSIYASPYYENEGAALGTAFTSGIVAGDCMIDYINGLSE